MMVKTKSFQVLNNRMRFKCFACGARRNFGVQSDQRRRRVRCHKCDQITNCVLDRREKRREMQAGRVVMVSPNGTELQVDLHDISVKGIGFALPIGAARALSLKQEIRFKCRWNPRLIGQGRFVIRNIKGSRIGAEKIDRH